MVEAFALPKVVTLEVLMWSKVTGVGHVCSKMIAISIKNLSYVTTFNLCGRVRGLIRIRPRWKPATEADCVEYGVAVFFDDFDKRP